MTKDDSSLSRGDFDRLIARAITLDKESGERIALDQARAIADELGVSAPAWDAALSEREPLRATRVSLSWRSLVPRRARLIALAGIGAGALSGALADRLGDGVLLLGTLAIAAAVALVVDENRQRSMRDTQVALAAWWASVAAGIMVGMGAPNVDPVVFAGVAWLGCASFGFIFDRLTHRIAETTSAPANPAG